MALNAIGGGAPLAIDAGVGIGGPSAATGPARAGSTFADTLGQAIQQVDALQQQADASSAEVARGGGNLHETALALEKADVALRVATRVRNKLVEAYQDVMRMSV